MLKAIIRSHVRLLISLALALSSNTVVIAYVDMVLNVGPATGAYVVRCVYSGTDELRSALVVMNPPNIINAYRHKIAHVIGMDQPDGQAAVPLASIMKGGSTIRQRVKNSGYVLYRRPIRNTTSDTDPSGHYININLLTGGASPALSTRPGVARATTSQRAGNKLRPVPRTR